MIQNFQTQNAELLIIKIVGKYNYHLAYNINPCIKNLALR